MSRIGKQVITVPEGVNIAIQGNLVEAKGKLGVLSLSCDPRMEVLLDNHLLTVKPRDESREAKQRWGLTRSLLNNIVVGVSTGYERTLEVKGVGYRALVTRNILSLSLGFSHEIKMLIPEGIEVKVEKNTLVTVKGANKSQVGEFCAQVIALRPPEPYKGKGVRFVGQWIRRKEGKKK